MRRQMVQCPVCETDSTTIRKEWKYSIFDAKSLYCKNCEKKFIAYYKNGKLNHTIAPHERWLKKSHKNIK